MLETGDLEIQANILYVGYAGSDAIQKGGLKGRKAAHLRPTQLVYTLVSAIHIIRFLHSSPC